MHRLHILAVLIGLFLCTKTEGQSLHTLLTKLFFNANLGQKDSSLIKYYDSNDLLKRFYNHEPDCKYKFTSHPYFSSSVDTSTLTLLSLGNSAVSEMKLVISFLSKTARDSAFASIEDVFKLYSKTKGCHLKKDESPYYIMWLMNTLTEGYLVLAKDDENGHHKLYVYID